MAKSRERLIAREMRLQGESVREIAKRVGVSRSSVSLQCNDIILDEQQTKSSLNRDLLGGEKGRIRAAKSHRAERQVRVNKYSQMGINRVDIISERELFLVGLALYWAEGCKNSRRTIFVNSDPEMICMFIDWVDKCFHIQRKDLTYRLQIKIIHKNRLSQIEDYWSAIIGISSNQFTKPTLIKAVSKKQYDHPEDYYGVLAITVKRGTNLSYLIDGGIQRLRKMSLTVVK